MLCRNINPIEWLKIYCHFVLFSAKSIAYKIRNQAMVSGVAFYYQIFVLIFHTSQNKRFRCCVHNDYRITMIFPTDFSLPSSEETKTIYTPEATFLPAKFLVFHNAEPPVAVVS